MAISFLAIPTSQPLGTFYTAVISASDLLAMCEFDYRQLTDKDGDPDFMGVQRPFSPKRVKEIAAYTRTVDACFPTSIVISIDDRCVTTKVMRDGLVQVAVEAYDDVEEPEKSVALSAAAAIIDGQHRLKGLEAADPTAFDMSVTVFVGADEAIRASLFSIVNLAQTKVNRSLVYDLFAAANERSPQKTCHNITVSLDKLEESPFYQRIKRLGATTEGRFGETLSQATVVRGMLQYMSKDPMLDRDRSLRGRAVPQLSQTEVERLILREFYRKEDDDAILDLMLNYFGAIRARWPQAWENDGRGNMINRTNGFDGFMKFFKPAYQSCTSTPRVVSRDEFRAIFNQVALADKDFHVGNFPPGSSGASALANELRRQTGL